jgi:hypothetical protein
MMGVGSSQNEVIRLVINAWAERMVVINAAVQEVEIVEEDFQKTEIDQGMTRKRVRMTKNVAGPPRRSIPTVTAVSVYPGRHRKAITKSRLS